MPNPYKPNDKVITKIKGVETEVTVRLIWNDEVQVKCLDGTLRWRTAKTVRLSGEAPKVEPPKDAGATVQVTHSPADSNDGQSPAPLDAPQPAPHDTPVPTTPAAPASTAPSPTPDIAPIAEPVLPNEALVQPPPNVTACGGDAQPVVKNRKRRRK